MWRGTSFSTLLHGAAILLLLFGLPSLPFIFKRLPENPPAIAVFSPDAMADRTLQGAPTIPAEKTARPRERPTGPPGAEPGTIEVALVPTAALTAARAARRSAATPPGAAAVKDDNEETPGRDRDARHHDVRSDADPAPPARKIAPGPRQSDQPPPSPRSVSRPAEPLAAVLRTLVRNDRRLARAVRPAERTPPSSAETARHQKHFERVRQAAEQGYVNAQFNLAVMMRNGFSAPPQPEEATRWLERAAERGYFRAGLLLAHDAIAAPPAGRDLARADFWLSVAAQRESKAAREARALLNPVMSLKDETRARQMRAEWRRMMAILAPVLASESDREKIDEELREAAEKGDADGVLSALLRGADAASQDRFGRNAIINAAWRGHDNIVYLMLKRGADIETADNKGRTPTNWAAINGHRRVIEMLLDAGADPDRIDAEGATALIRAAWNGHDAVVERLIAAGARLDTRTPEGKTALDYARRAGQIAVVRRLEAAQAKGGQRR